MRRRTLRLALLLSATLAGPVSASTIVVDPGGGGDSTTVQGGIDASVNGDVVQVQAGIYPEDIDFGGRNIEVVGLAGPGSTLLIGTGDGPVVVFETGEGPGALLSGFDVSDGNGSAGGSYDGGCIHVSGASPTLEDLVLHDCAAIRGAGIQLLESAATLSGVEIRDNEAIADGNGDWAYGGGLYAEESDLVLDTLNVHDNVAIRGGGMAILDGTTSISDSLIDQNLADRGAGIALSCGVHDLQDVQVTGNVAAIHSGGIWLYLQGIAAFSRVAVSENEAPYGGGLRVSDGSQGTVAASQFVGNVASGDSDPSGGGFRVDTASTLTVAGSLFQDNVAGFGGAGIAAQESILAVTSSRFSMNDAGSSGGALYLSESDSSIVGCTLDGNVAASDGGAVRVQAGTASISTSLFVDNAGSNGAGIHLYAGAEGELSHLTMVGNAASSGGTVRVTSDSEMELEDSIVAFPSAGSCISAADGSNWVIRYNDVYASSGTEWSGGIADLEGQFGNISASPAFVAYVADGLYDGDNLRLATGSPCIDMADPSGPADPDGSLPDMGAYGGADAAIWEAAADGDGDGWTIQDGDCDDGDPAVHPGAVEECNGIDDDCDGQPDEGCGDDDDSAGPDDDDSAGPDDDDSAGPDDDDSAATDDDDVLLDDDDAVMEPPETSDCSCEGSLAPGGARGVWLALALLVPSLTALRRRVSSARK